MPILKNGREHQTLTERRWSIYACLAFFVSVSSYFKVNKILDSIIVTAVEKLIAKGVLTMKEGLNQILKLIKWRGKATIKGL